MIINNGYRFIVVETFKVMPRANNVSPVYNGHFFVIGNWV